MFYLEHGCKLTCKPKVGILSMVIGQVLLLILEVVPIGIESLIFFIKKNCGEGGGGTLWGVGGFSILFV